MAVLGIWALVQGLLVPRAGPQGSLLETIQSSHFLDGETEAQERRPFLSSVAQVGRMPRLVRM